MAISQLPQAPYRQDRRVYPTPDSGDILFSEVRDCTRSEIPEYGTPHPNSKKWPDHKLVFVKPVDIERDGIFEFFYAAERQNQDLYNFSVGYRNIIGNTGGREFRVVQRSYVTPRADFQPLDIPFGTPMPDVPEGKFDDVEYVFFDREQKSIDQQELNSLYVAEVHTYVEKAFLDYKLSYGAQKSDLVPEKFRAAIPQTSTEQIVEGLAEPPTLTGSQISVTEDQLNPDVKLVREVSRDKPTSEVVLNGSQAYVGGTVADITETYSPTEIEADSGFLIQESRVTPTGDGAYVKETVSVEGWPTLISADWDDTLNALSIKRQTVQDPNNLTELQVPSTSKKRTSYEAVNEDRTIRIEEFAPANIVNYVSNSKTRINLNIPPVLKRVAVTYEYQDAVGNYEESGSTNIEAITDGTAGTSYSASVSGTVGVKPVLDIQTEQIWASDILATNYFFFVDNPDNYLSDLNRVTGLSILEWPIFKTKSYSVTVIGNTATSKLNGSGSKSRSVSEDREAVIDSEGFGEARSFGKEVQTARISQCLCAGVTISNPSAEIERTLTFSANGKSQSRLIFTTALCSPSSFEATSPPDVPRSGLYAVDSKIEPYKWGYYRAIVTVIDASQFA